jgi:uncharacterized protein YecE (DUF72 family)
MADGKIHIGIGGWSYDPWRGPFYPTGTKAKDELAYAASRLTAIEINATYYRSQTPKTFANWAAAAPDGFQFAVKASRFVTNRRVLAEAGESLGKFLNQGLTSLGDKLGPILWQFMPTKAFDADDMAAFVDMLPAKLDGVPLRHAIEGRHESFDDPAFVEIARAANIAIVHADHPDYPLIEADTADFTYARVMRAQDDLTEGYDAATLDRWADWARIKAGTGKEVYLFFIGAAKVRNPAAAQSLIARLEGIL